LIPALLADKYEYEYEPSRACLDVAVAC